MAPFWPAWDRTARCSLAGACVTLLGIAVAPCAGADTGAQASDLVQRGEYLTRAADCAPCHTMPGGKPFAGGRPLTTPFGTLTSPNITPDKETGIGAWTNPQFYRAVHEGVGRNGEDLYPVFPYTSFTKITRDDVLAIRAYLNTIEPVNQQNVPNGLNFPFNIRETLGVWRELFFTEGTFQPDPKQAPEWNRGAYLVEALGHCGECHTPRNILGATEADLQFAGAHVDNWFAPNISSNRLSGLGSWSIDDIVQFLKTGTGKNEATVFGPMSEVVHDSLRYLTDADIRAIATYLKSSPVERSPSPPAFADAHRKAGALVYLQNCAQCHQAKGRGLPGAVPPLRGNPAVLASVPDDVIDAVLNGIATQGNYGAMPSFAATLSDENIAAVADYVRTAWSNRSVPDATPERVAALRAHAAVAPPGTEAARAFDCPRESDIGAANTLADPGRGILDLLGEVDDANLGQRVSEAVANLRTNEPGIDDPTLVNTLVLAYCPVVAADPALGDAEKRARLLRFTTTVQRIATAGAALPAGVKILIQVPFPPDVLDKIDEAAARDKLSRDAWIERLVTHGLTSP